MKTQSISHRSCSFFSLNSAWRLALVGPLVFVVAVLVGYTATAKAPSVMNKIAGLRGSTTQLSERSRYAPPSIHRMDHLSALPITLGPVVFTDRPNYFPGETALITGLGFWPNEVVTLQVVHTDGSANDGGGHEPWNVAADAFGNFDTTWFVDPDDSAGSAFLLTATGNSSGLVAETTFTDGSANLDTCANGPANAPVPCAGEAWENGNLNSSKSHYAEGESVPYRTILENLIVGNTYTLTIEYDTTQTGKHAFDYLTSFDRTEPTPGNDPCTRKQGGSVVSICNPLSFVTTSIPLDPNVAAGQDGISGNSDDISQVPGVFTLYNGNALSVLNPGSPYTLDGTYAGNSSTSITVQFNATASIAVLAWGGHISTRLDWGITNSAIAINGSPYHMRLTDITCSGAGEVCNVGQQDHQLSADAVFFPIELTIIKETNPDNAQVKQFNYTTTGSNLGPFSLTPPNGTTPAQTQFSLTDTTARSVTESDPHAAAPQFNLTALSCTQTDGGLGVGTFTTNLGTRTVNFTPKEGQFISCTFVNTEDFTATRGRIIVDKVTNPSGDSTSFNFTSTYGDPFSLTDAAAPNDTGQVVMPGNYSVTETVPAGWDMTSSCTSSIGDTESAGAIELDAGETVTCTFTNVKRGHIIVDKVTNPSGDPQSFNFDASGGSYADFSLTDVAQPNDQALAPGNYSVSETVPAGWDMTSSCTSSIADTETAGAIELDAGETVTCTFTNVKRGHIIVDKVTDPSGDPQSFSFDANGGSYADFNLTDAAPPNDQTLVPGSYSVSETVPAGWDLTSSSCVSSIGDTESAASIELDAGETVTCTFNNQKDANIIVKKETDPNGDPQSFSFTASYDGDGFSLSDGQQNDSGDLDPGTYTVSETVPSGWDLTSSPCVSSKGDSETIGNISLQAGETVTCTFNNQKDAKIIVKKETDPNGDAQSFTFTASYDADGFSLSDGQENDSGDLDPGTYSVSETVPAGWDLTSSPCVSSKGDTETIGNISLQAGETVTCTFNNEKDAKIIVKKETDPNGDPQVFNFTASYDADGFSLSDGQENHSGDLDPGTYSVSETVPAGWDLTSSPCVSSKGDSETIGNISLQAGETVTCTFNNQKDAKIIVKKETDPNGDPQVFSFTASYDADGFSLSDGQENDSGDLDPGTYTVSETVPAGWDLTSSPCLSSNGNNESIAGISLQAGETVTCTFNNRKRATLIVEKQTNPDGANGSFTFTGTAAGTISDGGTITVGNLVPGTYASTETNPAPDFDLTGISCSDGNSTGDVPSRTATFRLEAGESVKCTFTNTQRGMAQVVKTVSGLPPAAGQSFTFEIRQGATTSSDGTVLETKNTDASGNINFSTKLVAGATYQICEWVFPGWNTNLAGDGPLFVPNSIIPPALPNPNVNNLTVCADFSVQPGQTRTFTVNNSPPPGGRALTIGFWKNWASCSNSNGKGQKPILDLALGIASATTTNPPGGLVASAQNPGSFWPNYASLWYLVLKGNPASTADDIRQATDCTRAVNLLNKSTTDGKKKMSSDPLFNMTAQLVAAQLNRFMGAGINGTTIMNIDRAVLLNGKYKFNGLTYTPKLNAADTNLANCLAIQLDNYNNGNVVSLCP